MGLPEAIIKTIHKKSYSKKFFKTHKKFSEFFHISKTNPQKNLIVPGPLKI